MTAFREEGRLVVVVPAHLTARQRRELVPGLVESFLAKEARRPGPRGDAELTDRVRALYRRYLLPALSDADGAVPAVPELGARWVSNQGRRWGSCTPGTGEIRVSDRLQSMPDWVTDYVLVHEAAHLVEGQHNARFHALVARYPETERAKAYLEGYEHGRAQARGEAVAPEAW